MEKSNLSNESVSNESSSQKEKPRNKKQTDFFRKNWLIGILAAILILCLIGAGVFWAVNEANIKKENIETLKENQIKLEKNTQDIVAYTENLQNIYDKIITDQKVTAQTAQDITKELETNDLLLGQTSEISNNLQNIKPVDSEAINSIFTAQKQTLEKRLDLLNNLSKSLKIQSCLVQKSSKQSEKFSRIELLLTERDGENIDIIKSKVKDAGSELNMAISIVRETPGCLNGLGDEKISQSIRKSLITDLNFYERLAVGLGTLAEGLDKNDENILDQANKILDETAQVEPTLYANPDFRKLLQIPVDQASELGQSVQTETYQTQEKIKTLES